MNILLSSIVCLPIAMAHDNLIGDFHKTKSMKISYSIHMKTKYLTIEDGKKIKEILETMIIEDINKGPQVGLFPKGTIDFILPKDRVIKIIFASPNQLDRANWGQIYLKNNKFYLKINEIISKAEGKEIDILKNNE